MTVLCGGGTSTLKPGIQDNVLITAGLVSGGLVEFAPILLPFAVLLDVFTYDALTQCAGDPPAMPSFTLADLTQLAAGPLDPNYETSLGKLKDALLNWLWYQWCYCTSGSPSPAFASPAVPTNTTLVTTGPTAPCSVMEWTGIGDSNSVAAASTVAGHQLSLTPYNTIVSQVQGGQTFQTVKIGAPAPVNFIVEEFYQSGGGASEFETVQLIFWNAAGVEQIVSVTGGTKATALHYNKTIVPIGTTNYDHVSVEVLGNATTPTQVTTVRLTVTCSGSGSGGIGQPCTTDPGTLLLLQQIASMLQQLLIDVPAPVSDYADSTVHTGLTGQGSFAVGVDTIAIRVNLTAYGAPVGVISSDPTTVFEAGWITPEAGGDPFRSQRISHPVQLFPIFKPTDSIHYTLAPTVTATITEVIRGP